MPIRTRPSHRPARRPARHSCTLAVACFAFLLIDVIAAAHQSAHAAQPAPRLVAPESLDQGFILVVRDASGLGAADSPIYLASNHTGWNPGLAAMRLTPRSDMRWQIVLSRPVDPVPMEFKFTRGSWDLVEVADDLSDIPNRTLPGLDAAALTPGQPPVIELTIRKFADQRPAASRRAAVDPYRPLEVTGSVRRLQVVGGGGPASATVRDILVWLPPGYDDPESGMRTYPVLYLHDGQNVFEQPPGAPGEWHADETAARLVEQGLIEPIVIVAVPNAGRARSSEYLPVDALRGIEPAGQSYLDFVISEVIPRVERAFRVRTDPEGRAIGGSSLGAVISIYAATSRPDVFGLLLAESLPLLGGEDGEWHKYLRSARSWPGRVFLGMGGKEAGINPAQVPVNDRYLASIRSLENHLLSRGVPRNRLRLRIDPDARHDEPAWATRLPEALQFLFPPSTGRP